MKMKIFSALIALFTITNCLSQTVTPPTAVQTDPSSPAVIFFEDFNVIINKTDCQHPNISIASEIFKKFFQTFQDYNPLTAALN